MEKYYYAELQKGIKFLSATNAANVDNILMPCFDWPTPDTKRQTLALTTFLQIGISYHGNSRLTTKQTK